MALTLDAALEQDSGAPAAPLHLIGPGGLSAWRGQGSAAIGRWIDANSFTAKPGEILLLPEPDGGALVGIDAAPGPWSLAAAAAKVPPGRYRCVPAPDDPARAGLMALGWALAQYRFDRYRKPPAELKVRTLLLADGLDLDDLRRQVRATALVRDLVNTPAADLGPGQLAAEAEALARRHGAQISLCVGDALLEAGYPAIHAVGRAAADAPRLIDLTWGKPDQPLLVLVGKGVCFDSGGLDIKPASGMALMKKDMGGAAHALALAQLVMEAKLPVRLRVLIPAVENAISGNAFRPGDVLATRAGLSVEIGNTDAEGRLILCDALTEAARAGPDLVLDFATLTGAARVALGPDLPALFTPDDALAADLAAAARDVEDPLWRLPLWAPYADYLKSSIADINNAGDSGFAGAITAALFLQRFVPAGIAWAHIDLFAWLPAVRNGQPKGGEAMSLRATYLMLKRRYSAV